MLDLQHLDRWARRVAPPPGGTTFEQPSDRIPNMTVMEDPRGDPPSRGGRGLEAHRRHVRRKVDQIAYVTNILLSMTFIATVYGMNLDIFTDGGLVSVNKFIATALPFTVCLFVATFFKDVFEPPSSSEPRLELV